MPITREDRNLLVRVGKHLRDALAAEERGNGSTPLRDRLLRDERDLQALRRKLEHDGGQSHLPLAGGTDAG